MDTLNITAVMSSCCVSTMLDTLPFDVFSHTLDFIGVDTDLGIPLCSRSCRELWLEHAEKEIRRLTHLFARHFHFDDETSLTRRYLTVVHAHRGVNRSFSQLKKSYRICETGNIPQERALVRTAGELLARNPLVQMETAILNYCLLAVQKAFRKKSLVAMNLDNGPVDSVVLKEAQLVLKSLLHRQYAVFNEFRQHPAGLFKLNRFCDAAYLLFFTLGQPHAQVRVQLHDLLAGRQDPPHIPSLAMMSYRLLGKGLVNESLVAYLRAVNGCVYMEQSHFTRDLVRVLEFRLSPSYGPEETDFLQGETRRICSEALVEPGPLPPKQLEFADELYKFLLWETLPLVDPE